MILFESTFPNGYRKTDIKKILGYVSTGKFCQVVSSPGGGKATILKLLAHNRSLVKFHLKEREKLTRFEYINLLELNNYNELNLFNFLHLSLTKEASKSTDIQATIKKIHAHVNNLSNQNQLLVLLFDHFDEYQNQLPKSFFQLLGDLKSLAKYKFSAVFATRRDLKDLVDPELTKKYYDFFLGNAIYLKIYDKDATNLLLTQTEEVSQKKISPQDKTAIIGLTGGHAKLTKIIAELVLRENIKPDSEILAKNPLCAAALSEIWDYLTAQEQIQLEKLAKGYPDVDHQILESLTKFDLIHQSSNITMEQSNNILFTIPIFAQFVLTQTSKITPDKITYNTNTNEIKKGERTISDLLSPQEFRLLKFLIASEGKIINRDEIIPTVWPDAKTLEGISDEAIDQMVFRLRKKIEDEPASPKHITTIKGQGWRFSP